MTSAATVMVSVFAVFAVFATLSLLEMKPMGVGLAVAVLLDATLVRVVMLPSLLVPPGRAARWPRARGGSSSIRCESRSWRRCPNRSPVPREDPTFGTHLPGVGSCAVA